MKNRKIPGSLFSLGTLKKYLTTGQMIEKFFWLILQVGRDGFRRISVSELRTYDHDERSSSSLAAGSRRCAAIGWRPNSFEGWVWEVNRGTGFDPATTIRLPTCRLQLTRLSQYASPTGDCFPWAICLKITKVAHILCYFSPKFFLCINCDK
jgi:hypothetical protein